MVPIEVGREQLEDERSRHVEERQLLCDFPQTGLEVRNKVERTECEVEQLVQLERQQVESSSAALQVGLEGRLSAAAAAAAAVAFADIVLEEEQVTQI